MRGIILTFLILTSGLWVSSQAQYIGSSRPPSRQEMLDSLAARLDTARFTADSLRLDSLAAAGAVKDAALDTRIDSLRDNAGGGGNTSLTVPLAQSVKAMYDRNVKQILTLADYENWADSVRTGAGDATWNTTYYKTDSVALSMTADAGQGGHISFSPALDLAHFGNGDTATAAQYIVWATYLDQADIDSSTPDVYSLEIYKDAWPAGAGDNFYYYLVPVAGAAVGWNYHKVAKSAFGSVGSPNWSGIDHIGFRATGTNTGIITPIIDNVQLLRKDSSDTRPNPFQLSGADRWNETTTASLTIYRGSLADDTVGIQAMVCGDYITSAISPADSLSGKWIVNQTDSSRVITLGVDSVRVTARGGNKILLLATGGIGDSVDYDYAAKDTLDYHLMFEGDSTYSLVIEVNSGGDSTLTAYTSAAPFTTVRVRPIGNDRLLNIPQLTSNLWKILIGGHWFWNTADSTTVNN